LTSAALIAAKLKVAVWSTLAAWLLVLIAIPVGLSLAGTALMVVDPAIRLAEAIGMIRTIALALLALLALMTSTWKQLVQSLYIGLSGREWLIKASGLASLTFVAILGPLAQWIHDDRNALLASWNALPWIPVILVFLKMCAGIWVVIRLYQSRLLDDLALILGAASWLITVFALYGVLVWLLDTPLLGRYFFLLVAILAVPLVRLSAAPLALAWNRHR
jgi:hypothetical protein